MASIAKRISGFAVDALATATGWGGALVVMTALILLLGGCTSTDSIQSVSEICTMGDVQAYQRVSPEEKVSFVCK